LPPEPNADNQDVWQCSPGESELMCYNRPEYDFFWYAQHAPGYSCIGYNRTSGGNTLLKQRGACWFFDPVTSRKRCYNNRTRSNCMARPGFLGFNATKNCSETGAVSSRCLQAVASLWRLRHTIGLNISHMH
jgi:hypothetical protein